MSLAGAPVLEKVLDRKPRNCEQCGYDKWIKGDKLFIISDGSGGMAWLCPNCALERGLPKEYYQKNHFATSSLPEIEELATPQSRSIFDFAACMCHF